MKKLKMILIVTTLLSMGIEAQPTKRDIANTINIAGKQRMLTQKMSKEALLIAKDIDVDANKIELSKTINLFDTTLHALLNGDEKLKIEKIEDEKIREKLKKVNKLWGLFKPFINKVAKGKYNRTSLKAIEMGNIPLLLTIDSAVKMYANKYSLNLKNNLTTTINLAGKERMLSQKMSKEFLLIAHKLESNKYLNSLKRGGNFFKETLNELIQNRKEISNPDTIKELIAITELWKKYQEDIANAELSKEGILIFNKKEKQFIEEMTNRLTIVATKIDKRRYQDELQKSSKEFDEILNGLINGDEKLGLIKSNNRDIQEKLSIIKSVWLSYKKIIFDKNISNQKLKKIMILDKKILKNMNIIVKEYELLN